MGGVTPKRAKLLPRCEQNLFPGGHVLGAQFPFQLALRQHVHGSVRNPHLGQEITILVFVEYERLIPGGAITVAPFILTCSFLLEPNT